MAQQPPAEQLAAILTNALNQWVKDNPDLFTVNVQDTGGGGGGGGGSGDIVAIILGLASLGLIGGAEFLPLIEALKGAQKAGGSDGVSFTVGYFLASTLLQFAEPYTRQLSHQIENAAQSQILDPPTAADLVTRGIISEAFGESEAGGGGFDKPHFAWLTDAAYNRPSWDVALRLWNRGYINEDDVNTSLQRGGVPQHWWDSLKSMRRELLTPADWALAALRRNVDVETATAGAEMWGLTKDDFNTLLLNTGEPPGTMQLLEAFRRDFIDQDQLTKGILESRVRDEWIDTLIKLRYAPMSTAAAANAVVRGYLAEQDGAAIAQQNGLEPEHWQYVLESNGRPLSHEQLNSLYLRGLITEAEVKQGIRESDIKDKYINQAFELRVKFLPLFEARTLLNDGSITGETFASQLLVQGYQKEVIDEIIHATGKGKKTAAKHLTAADYTDLYMDGLKTREETLTGLHTIGYTEADAVSIVDIAEAKATAKIVNQQVANVRSQFDRYRLTEDAAAVELDKIGLQPQERDRLVKAWALVRPEGTRGLTEAQILKAAKLGAITIEDAYNRLRGLGLNRADAELLVEISG